MKLEKTNLLKEKERLEKENKELKKTIKILEGELDIEKDISDGMLEAIDKAIEYINGLNHFELDCNKPFRKVSKYEEAYIKREKDLLDILKGE